MKYLKKSNIANINIGNRGIKYLAIGTFMNETNSKLTWTRKNKDPINRILKCSVFFVPLTSSSKVSVQLSTEKSNDKRPIIKKVKKAMPDSKFKKVDFSLGTISLRKSLLNSFVLVSLKMYGDVTSLIYQKLRK